jgi:mRNA interferase MazF
MITSAENRAWPNDVPIVDDAARTGILAPSVIRPAKIATVDARNVVLLGRVATITTRIGDGSYLFNYWYTV